MIEQLEIHQFRGIDTGKLDHLRQFNLFVGPNNSGKSALLEAIYLTATASRPASLTVSGNGQAECYLAAVPGRDMLNQPPSSHLTDESNNPGYFSQGALKLDLMGLGLDLYPTNNYFSKAEAQQINLFRLPPDPEQGVRLADLATQLTGQPVEDWPSDQTLTFCWQRELTHSHRERASWWVRGDLPPAHHVLHYDMLAVQEHLPAAFYEEMLATVPGWTQKIAQRFGRIFDLSPSFTVQFLPPKQEQQAIQGWIAPEESTAVPIDAWGDGARAAFKLLTPLIALAHLATPDKPGLLLWEAPEMFQHPQTLGKLLHEVADIVRGKPIQIFMVSHSLEVITHLTQMLQENVLPADKTIALSLNLEQGQLQSTWFDADNLLSWLGSGLDPRISAQI